MPDMMMYESGSGNKLYIPAMVLQTPSTYSMAKIRPEYVTETDARPSSARNTKYISNESAKNRASPVEDKNKSGWSKKPQQRVKDIYRRMTGTRQRWKAFSCGQTYPTACPRLCHRWRLRWGNPFRRQASNSFYRKLDSTRCSTCFRDRPSC